MIKLIRALALLLGTLFLISCGGGGDGDSSVPTTPISEANGIWVGIFHSNVLNQNADFKGVIYNGEAKFVSFTEQTMYAGSISLNGNSFTANVSVIQAGGGVIGTATITGTYTPSGSMNGSYTTTYGDAGTISGVYDPIYDRNSSLSIVNDMWFYSEISGNAMTIIVDASGNVSGSDTTGCLYNGSVAILDSNHNLYDVTVNATNCGLFNGTYNGYATVADYATPNDNNVVYLIVNSSSYIYYIPLIRQ